MQEEARKSTLDDFVEKAESRGLLRFMTITESTTSVWASSQGSPWRNTNHTESSVSGDVQKMEEIRELLMLPQEEGEEREERNDSEEEEPERRMQLAYQFPLKQGEPFPRSIKLSKVGYDYPQVVAPTAGKVFVLLMWGNSFWEGRVFVDGFQKMLRLKETAWEDRVTFVGVNISHNQEMTMRHIESSKWTCMEHFKETRGDRTLSKIFGRQLTICLADKDGIVSEVMKLQSDHATVEYIESQIDKLVLGETQTKLRAEDSCEPGTSEHESGVLKLLDSLPAPPNTISIELKIDRKRVFNKGAAARLSAGPLSVTFESGSLEEMTAVKSWVQAATEGLNSKEFSVNGSCKDPALQIQLSFEKLGELLAQHGFEARPVMRLKRSIDVKEDQSWRVAKCLSFSHIPYTSAETMERYNKLAEEAQTYSRMNRLTYQARLVTDNNIKFVGEKFVGIFNLLNSKTKQRADILPIPGVLQFVSFISKRSGNGVLDSLHRIKRLVEAEPGKVLMHLLFANNESAPHLGLLTQSNPDIRCYISQGKPSSCSYLFSNEHLLVVNRNCVVAYCRNISFYPAVSKAIEEEGETPAPTVVTREFGSFMENLCQDEDFKCIREALKSLNYPAKFTISYTEENFDPQLTQKVIYSPEIEVCLRRCDMPIVESFLKRFGKETLLLCDTVDTIQLPLGDKCADCAAELKLPYYYYFVSKLHKCCACAEVQDQDSAQAMRRYPTLENSVLIIKDREVDVKRLGLNLQPETEEECLGHSFCCDSCGGNSGGQCRYICMGCRREPNRRDNIDFCLKCMMIIRGTDEQAKDRIVTRNLREGHTKDHSLLKVLYRPADYYRF